MVIFQWHGANKDLVSLPLNAVEDNTKIVQLCFHSVASGQDWVSLIGFLLLFPGSSSWPVWGFEPVGSGTDCQSYEHRRLREFDPKEPPPTELSLFSLHETRDFVEVPPEQEPSKEQLFPPDYNKVRVWPILNPMIIVNPALLFRGHGCPLVFQLKMCLLWYVMQNMKMINIQKWKN